MKLNTQIGQNFINEETPELKGLKGLCGLFAFFIIASIIMPQYFGVHLGYDITCARLGNMLFVGYILLNKPLFTHFIKTIMKCEVTIPLCAYLFVAAYTMVYRVDINALFLIFLEILSFYMMIYGIRYVVGYKKTIKWIIGCSYFLGVYGLVEFVYGRSIFLQFLSTMPTAVTNDYRSGHYRIMGPCGHSLAYGLVLLLFIAIACYDTEKNEVYLFKRPFLLIVLLANVFLTGSRSTLGIAILEVVLIICFSNKMAKIKSILLIIVSVAGLGIFLLLFGGTGIGRYFLGQIASVIDEALGTSFALNFGVDVTTLKNSAEYRKVLPYVFKLDWLNPLVGRGSKGFNGAEINGLYVHSIDNYYVMQYIKYAYPGMIAYVGFMIVSAVVMIVDLFKRKSGLTKIVFIACVVYFINLWWVDALQTLKYMYILLAVFYAGYLEKRDASKL